MSKIPLLMTRPAGANASFVQLIDTELLAKIEVIDCPLTRIDPIASDLQLTHDTVVIFTSMNGVKFAPPGNGRSAFCVGTRTTEAARRSGWKATYAGPNADALVDHIVAAAPSAPLMHLSGRHVRGQVAERLSTAGFPTDRIALYEQVRLPLSSQAEAILSANIPVIVPLFSPRAAAQFAAVCPTSAKLLIAVLSAAVLESLGKIDFISAQVAHAPNAVSLAAEVEKLIRWNSLG